MENGSMDNELIIQRLSEINKRAMAKFERCAGISPSRLEILREIYESEEITQRALQKKVNIDHAAVTRHLKQLEENGMVVRRKNPEDQRFTYVQLSEEGKRKVSAYCEEKQRFISSFLKGFTDEETEALLQMLTRLQKNIEEI
ncbi:MarR family transcriptional regulator [Bacillus sp. ISL-35]|uniref:MarR family winged helix-turn-helix transcriptional regulator n=1 Tax=Bacillus sp. ISL-35 TaxID=2819122 RepID=UPI001BEB7DEA|nr:MarR family transcriptional regulator [Bacillus sp. ISL-35]MBT2680489.1 MarR family transcriptional regulator [Bacillus sp. ISL-35]MBT2704218.1 MarR family transcriptional regulator [Chryseobacterium sp. ISL-80]